MPFEPKMAATGIFYDRATGFSKPRRLVATASEPYGLFRDGPFQPLYLDGRGFRKPPTQEDPYENLWSFKTEEAARFIAHRMRGRRVFVDTIKNIKSRIRRDRNLSDVSPRTAQPIASPLLEL